MPVPEGRWRYYDGMLYLLALLEVSGRFQIHAPAAT
jgi:oligosaccharide reducing-end xylanase